MIMSVITSTPRQTSLRDRLSLKLILLFCMAFLLTFVMLWAYDFFASAVEFRLAESNLPPKPASVGIDPNLQKDLAKVLEFDSIPMEVEIKNPFSDTNNISDIKSVPIVSSSQNSLAQSGNPQSGGGNEPIKISAQSKGSAEKTAPTSKTSTNNGSSISVSNTNNKKPPEDTLTRIVRRNERLGLGLSVVEESQVFAIEDLLPVGVVSGGNKDEEVMFFSQSLQRTLSFTIGTQFYDGWLVSYRPEGTIFRYKDEFQSVRVKSWERNINSQVSKSQALLSPRRTLGNDD